MHSATRRTNSVNIMDLLQGQTPLHYAAAAQADNVLNLLLTAGADPKAADSKVSTTITYGHGDLQLGTAHQQK